MKHTENVTPNPSACRTSQWKNRVEQIRNKEIMSLSPYVYVKKGKRIYTAAKLNITCSL